MSELCTSTTRDIDIMMNQIIISNFQVDHISPLICGVGCFQINMGKFDHIDAHQPLTKIQIGYPRTCKGGMQEAHLDST